MRCIAGRAGMVSPPTGTYLPDSVVMRRLNDGRRTQWVEGYTASISADGTYTFPSATPGTSTLTVDDGSGR